MCKTKLKSCTLTRIRLKKDTVLANHLPLTVEKRCIKKLNASKPKSGRLLKILTLQQQLYNLTKPNKYAMVKDMNPWHKKIMKLNNQIYTLQQPEDNTPKTVGDYFKNKKNNS